MVIRLGEGWMHYTISEMSKLLGVTTHMLRYYEKIGIIRPVVNPENGYRYYSVVDTRRFNLSRQMFSAGVPLEQCMQMMDDMPTERIQMLLDEKIREREIELERTKISIRFLERLKETYDELDTCVGRISVRYYPTMWRLNFSDNERAFCDKALEREKERWLACMPATYWVSKIPNEVLTQFSQGVIDYQYGLMISEADARALGLRRSSLVEIVPGGDYLFTTHRKAQKEPFKWDDVQFITEYIKAHNISFFGDAYSNIVASRIEDGKEINYHHLRLKIYT